MILKRLYEEYDFKIETILFKEYKRLKLSSVEMNVLVVLVLMYKKRKSFSTNAIVKRSDYSINEVNNAIQALVEKDFLSFDLETTKDQKQREIFILDNMFKKIEALLLEDDINKTKQAIQTDIAEIIELFEGGLNRVLLSTELEIIRLWFEKGMYPVERIKEVIRDNQRSLSVKKVDKVLSQNIVLTDKIDEEKAEALKRIFKSI